MPRSGSLEIRPGGPRLTLSLTLTLIEIVERRMKHGDCLDLEVEEESSVLTSMGAVEIEAGEQVSFLSCGGGPTVSERNTPATVGCCGRPAPPRGGYKRKKQGAGGAK